MTWSIHQQQQQRGAQMPKSGAPAEATRDRSAQDHEKAGAQAMPATGYPATRLDDRHGDITPTAPEAQVSWDEVVQPEARKAPADNLPLPEGVTMGEYAPDDSRNVTLRQNRAPGEPPRTGPREGESRQQKSETELEQDESGEDPEQVADAGAEQALREASMEQDTAELNEAARSDRND